MVGGWCENCMVSRVKSRVVVLVNIWFVLVSNVRELERKLLMIFISINLVVMLKVYNKWWVLLFFGRCEDVCECECVMMSYFLIIFI